ncbi:MAG TPA: ABC transporter permease, partial [Firmicutes bacterium]|nr:ABC transporter permease [Bacillota bacterium]
MFKTLTTFEFKLHVRNFFTMFFALAFPIMMLLLFGAMYGNEPSSLTGDRGTVDLMLPAYTCMIVAVTGLMSLPLTVANYREQKILKRFMATPIQPMQILVSQVVVNSITTVAGIGLLLVVAKLVYSVQFFGNVLTTLMAFLLVMISMFSLGLVIAGVTPNARAATSLAFILYFPMLFLSGASIPLYIMPKGMIVISKLLPLTYGVRLLSGV